MKNVRWGLSKAIPPFLKGMAAENLEEQRTAGAAERFRSDAGKEWDYIRRALKATRGVLRHLEEKVQK